METYGSLRGNPRLIKNGEIQMIEIIKNLLQGKESPRNIMAHWRERNSVHSRVFLQTLEVDYLVFEEDVFMMKSSDLMIKLERIGFTTQFTVSNDKFGPLCTTYWNKEHNIVIRLVSQQNWETLTLALEVIALLKKSNEKSAISMTDIVVSTMMTLNSHSSCNKLIRFLPTESEKSVSLSS
jgi:hypothetical protein